MTLSGIELLAAILIPLLVLVLLRINAAMVFMSLCLGYVLVQFVANDADSFINFVAPNRDSMAASTLRLALLFIPAILTSLITIWSIHGRIRVVANVLPAVGVAALAVVFAVPQLSTEIMAQLQGEQLWQQFMKAQALFIAVSALISLLMLWTQHRTTHHADQGKHRR